MFNHCTPKELLELDTITINGRRHYVTPKGKYPSITSVFSAFPKPELQEWRNRVGEQEAKKITTQATNRGTKIHSLCENYLNNEDLSPKNILPIYLESFNQLIPELNKINNIHKLEAPLYSNQLKVAGRTDCIAEYNNVLSVIDFKTSIKPKKEEWITDYFLQATFYAMAYWELTNIKISQIVIIISVDEGDAQVFVKDVKNYVKPLIQKIHDYYHILDM